MLTNQNESECKQHPSANLTGPIITMSDGSTFDAREALASDKRLQLIGARKSGYSGHIPKCVYYDRERIPAPIHRGSNIPPRPKLQLDGTFVPTQTMVREQQKRLAALGGSAPVHPPVASVNEIGLASHSPVADSPKTPRSVIFARKTDGGSFGGSVGVEQRPNDSVYKGACLSGAHEELPISRLARPFTDNPSGNGRFGHYPLSVLAGTTGGYNNTGSGGAFSSTISPPRSPTARYYKQLRDENAGRLGGGLPPPPMGASMASSAMASSLGSSTGKASGAGASPSDFAPHPGLINAASGVPVRYRHMGAGGVCCGTTEPYQYGRYLHHDDVAIHGAPTKLLPHVYGVVDGTKPFFGNASSDGSIGRARGLRSSSGGGNNMAATIGEGDSRHNALMDSTLGLGGTASGAPKPTPFPRYPILRGPNRVGPRGLEAFLTN